MTSGMSIQVLNAEKIRRKLRPEVITGPLRTLLTQASLTAEKTAKQNAPRWKGQLKRDIRSEVKPLQARVFTGRNLAYYAVMEKGRRPGAKMPPVAAIARWARSKGITVSPFVLARAIARRGIKGRFFFKAGHDAARARLADLLRRMGQDIAQQYGRST